MRDEPAGAIRTEQAGATRILIMEHGPVNTLAHPVRQGVAQALLEAELDPGVAAVVLTGAGGHFCGGADLDEFASGTAMRPPSLHGHIIPFIETMTKPVVAAIEGFALGGGLELALGCHARVALAEARVGLPETNFGLIPGAGGTVRLPRAVGTERAAEMIVAAQVLPAGDLAATALFDEIVTADVTAAATAHALRLADAPRPLPRLRDRTPETPDPAAFDALQERHRRRPSARATALALGAVRRAVEAPFDAAVQAEYADFIGLLLGDESAALRHLFQAERAAPKVADLPAGTAAADVRRVGVVGAGFMGAGIARACAAAGLDVAIHDTDAAAADRLAGDGIRPVAELAALADCDLVIEAAKESLAVKRAIFAELDRLCPPGTLLATNTSSIAIEDIAAATAAPERVIGIHFFGPVKAMRLVEVVRSDATAPAAIATAMRFARGLRKLPVCVRSGPGFLGNRLFDRYLDQALALAAEGIPPARIDAALKAFGMRAGPFRTMDLIGLDVLMLARADELSPGWRLTDALARAGRHGVKSGAGWYRYDETGRAADDPALADVLPPPADDLPDDGTIAARCVLALVNEGARALEDGIAQRPGDIDVALVAGYGFPAAQGGPMFWAGTRGLPRTLVELTRLAAEAGDAVWAPAATLRDRALEGEGYHG